MKYLRYIAAFIVFIIVYSMVQLIYHLVFPYFNTDVQGWVRENVIPYFAAIMAGFFGASAGLAVVDYMFASVRLRPIAWAFICIFGFLWLFPLLGIAAGVPQEKNISELAVQSLTAFVTAWYQSRDKAVR